MAVPFRRTSKTKKRMRRTHLKKELPGMTVCTNVVQQLNHTEHVLNVVIIKEKKLSKFLQKTLNNKKYLQEQI